MLGRVGPNDWPALANLVKEFLLPVPRWMAWTALAVVVALGAGATGWVVMRGNDDALAGWSSDGPVVLPFDHGYVARYGEGDVFTDGFERIRLSGSRPGVLEKVELVGPDVDRLEIVGVLLAVPERDLGSYQVAPGYPPRHPEVEALGTLVEAEGAPLATGKVGSVMQIGIKVLDPGLLVRTGVRIYYTVDGERYTALLPGAISVCPDAMSDDECTDAFQEAAGW